MNYYIMTVGTSLTHQWVRVIPSQIILLKLIFLCTQLKLDICHSLVSPLQAKMYWPFQGGASFVDPFCYLCFRLVFVMSPCLFLAALWFACSDGLASVVFSCVFGCYPI